MPSISDLCEKYYGTRDAYALLGISKDALVKDGKIENIQATCGHVTRRKINQLCIIQ